jgi:hypothetical protein
MRRNGVVQVPDEWVDAVYALYLKGGKHKVYIPWASLPYAKPGTRIAKGLAKLYPKGSFGLKVYTAHSLGSAAGTTAYPQPGRSLEIGLLAGMKRPKNTIRHELRHVVQHLGDMAIRVTLTPAEKKRYKGGKVSGRFGRPSPKTVAALRGWKQGVKAAQKPVTKAAWYYRSASEYDPHVGDAAAWVVRKLPADPTPKQVNAQILKAFDHRAILQHLTPAEAEDAGRKLYAEVQRLLRPKSNPAKTITTDTLGLVVVDRYDWPFFRVRGTGKYMTCAVPLYTTQKRVHRDVVAQKIRAIHAGQEPTVSIAKVDGQMWIFDGHHTWAAYKQLGQTPRCFQYDAGGRGDLVQRPRLGRKPKG